MGCLTHANVDQREPTRRPTLGGKTASQLRFLSIHRVLGELTRIPDCPLITRRSQVRILSPLPLEAPGIAEISGAFSILATAAVWDLGCPLGSIE